MNANESAGIVKAVTDLTNTVSGKVKEIDDKVHQATSAVPDAVKNLFIKKKVSIDEVNGDDSSLNGPFKTLKAAILSVLDGGYVEIKLPISESGYIYNLSESIYIGKRKVVIIGGYAGMEKGGVKASVLAPQRKFNSKYNRTYFSGYMSGSVGGSVTFNYLRTMLPRIINGTSLEHGKSGSFLSGTIAVSVNSYTLSEPSIFVENDGTDECPMFFAQSSARDAKYSIQEISLSHADIETSNAAPLFSLQYGTGTLRFGAYGVALSDSTGEPIEWSDLFSGLQYGSHGYATNLLSQEKITKQKD